MTNKETGIGTPVLRRKDDRFVRGAGEFSDDIVMPGALTAVVLRAPIPHGEILAIDTTAALAAPGVHAVLTAADLANEITGAPAAVMNALVDALRPAGAEPVDMPATPEKVWRALRAAGKQ